jgi:hypothetical protein
MSVYYFLLCIKLTEENVLHLDGLIANYYKMCTELLKNHECMSDWGGQDKHYVDILRILHKYCHKRKEQQKLIKLYKDRIYKIRINKII